MGVILMGLMFIGIIVTGYTIITLTFFQWRRDVKAKRLLQK